MKPFISCKACRKYGVKLLDGLCNECYTEQRKPHPFTPGLPAKYLLDGETGQERRDIRKIRKFEVN